MQSKGAKFEYKLLKPLFLLLDFRFFVLSSLSYFPHLYDLQILSCVTNFTCLALFDSQIRFPTAKNSLLSIFLVLFKKSFFLNFKSHDGLKWEGRTIYGTHSS